MDLEWNGCGMHCVAHYLPAAGTKLPAMQTAPKTERNGTQDLVGHATFMGSWYPGDQVLALAWQLVQLVAVLPGGVAGAKSMHLDTWIPAQPKA